MPRKCICQCLYKNKYTGVAAALIGKSDPD